MTRSQPWTRPRTNGRSSGSSTVRPASAPDRTLSHTSSYGDRVGAQELAQLHLQLERGERRRQRLVGVRAGDLAACAPACRAPRAAPSTRASPGRRAAPRARRATPARARSSRAPAGPAGGRGSSRAGRRPRPPARPRSGRRPPPGRSPACAGRARPAASARAARTSGHHRRRRPSVGSLPPDRGRHVGRVPARGHAAPRHGVGQRPGGVDHHARGRHQVAAGLEAPVGRLVEPLGDHRVEPRRQLRPHVGELRRRLAQVRVDDRHVGVALERHVAREAVEEQARERVDVGARVDVAALDLLGRDVVDRPHQLAGLGQPATWRRRSAWSARSRSGTRGGPRSARCPA